MELVLKVMRQTVAIKEGNDQIYTTVGGDSNKHKTLLQFKFAPDFFLNSLIVIKKGRVTHTGTFECSRGLKIPSIHWV